MKVHQVVWVLPWLAVAVAAAQQPNSSSITNEVMFCIPNPDGSVIKAHADTETLLHNFVGEYVNMTNAAGREFFAATKAQAEKGNPAAQVILGLRYFGGLGVETNTVEAVKWFRKAADQKNPDAANNLAACYAYGFGGAKDEEEAVKWYRKAAEQDDGDAQYWLGVAYETGKGVKQNVLEAAKWYRKASQQQHLAAQKWLRKAANEGDASAQCSIGNLYRDGIMGAEKELEDRPGVSVTEYKKEPVEAAKWYRRAADQGDADAQFSLGLAHTTGKGVALDYVEAYKWSNLAAAQEGGWSASAAVLRDALAKEMTPDQISEAQRLARAFKPRKESRADDSSSPEKLIASGTGFFISEDGFLVTNEHVVRDAAQMRLVTSAGLISAKLVRVDSANDLALLKAEATLKKPRIIEYDDKGVEILPTADGNSKFSSKFLPVSPSRGVKLGGTVVTVGFPNIGLQGFAPKLAKGEIAALSGAGDDARYFQISVPVQPGNSGGALVDERGNVVGVVAAKLSASAALRTSGALPENVNYAIKSSYLLSFLESVPEVAAKLREPNAKEKKFEDVVKEAEQAAVLVLVY